MSHPTVSLLLGVHNHQPVDNWDHVLEDATEKCYRPFLELLYRFPAVKMSVHYTGYLLNWLAQRHPELVSMLKEMVQRGQVEFFTGGMYEPIMPIIPDEDKIEQVVKLTGRIEELIGVKPKGMWLAERVWEPHLVKYLADSGIKYVCLDDSHFNSVGLDDTELLGRYISEEQGKTVDIFPISKQMRYLIPYVDPKTIVDYLCSIATVEGNRAAIYFDDGEKFGVWPGTYHSVYVEKWLERFFEAIQANQQTIKCRLYSEYVEHTPPFGRVYLPTASYSEMLTWALPAKHVNELEDAQHNAPEEYQRFLRGGFWRHFLVKYPESNNLHKKMLYVSKKVRQMKSSDARQQEALDHLWQGQSNDAFWHGVFGGLYLTNLRYATYKHLLMAENIADRSNIGEQFLRHTTLDFDLDGHPEILIESSLQNIYIDPDEGGGIFELDYRPKSFNLLDTMARRYEPYHDKLAHAVMDDGTSSGEVKTIHDRIVTKEKDLDKLLHYDWHRRMSLLDHFLAEDTNLDKLYEVKYGEQGDFVGQPYQVKQASDNKITLERLGNVWIEGRQHPVRVQKSLAVARDSAETVIEYVIGNESSEAIDLWFAPEFNVNLLAPDAHDRYYRILPVQEATVSSADKSGGVALAAAPKTETITDTRMISKGVLESIPGIELVDEWMELAYQLSFDRPTTLWRFPIETVSQSEGGFERVYQSSAIFPNWKFRLEPRRTETIRICQKIITV